MERHGYATSQEVNAVASGRWLDIFKAVSPALGPAVDALAKRSRSHVPCPVHGGTDGFRLFQDVNSTGTGICNTCGTRQGIDLIAWAEGIDYLQAKDLVAAQVGLLPDNGYRTLLPATPRIIVPQDPLTPAEAARRRLRILKMIRSSLHVMDTRAEPLRRYLAGRGLSPKSLNEDVFRYHPRLPYFNETGEKVGDFPALLAFFHNAEGRGVTIHRTYFTEDGEKIDRKVAAYDENAYSLSGSAIRLTRPERVLSVGEGIETMLSVLMSTRMPCWATGSADLLANLAIPDCVEELWIWADKDRSKKGEEVALKLCERAWASGRKARVILPHGEIPYGKKSRDWNDVWMENRKAGFPEVDTSVKLKRAA